jgi:hypothetical protein
MEAWITRTRRKQEGLERNFVIARFPRVSQSAGGKATALTMTKCRILRPALPAHPARTKLPSSESISNLPHFENSRLEPVTQEEVRVRRVAPFGVLYQRLAGKQVAEARSKVDIGPQLVLKVLVGSLTYIARKGAAFRAPHN